MPLTASLFAAKWKGSQRTERAASQEHFIDLCQMLGFQTPNEADPAGSWYAFEKGVDKIGGGDGFADVWKRGHFAWEYKGKRKDLVGAYNQLLQYREALENPPLLIVCDLDRFQVHTNFTNSVKKVYDFSLKDFADNPSEPLRILRAVMANPESLKPADSPHELTEVAAAKFADLAKNLRGEGHDPHRVAHFLNKLVFCMFAEDSGLLPPQLIGRLADNTKGFPAKFTHGLKELFFIMSDQGGLFGAEEIQWFNGGLFDNADVLPLTGSQIDVIKHVSELDWSQIEPAIFGTLFERGLDPEKRSQLGAHYTDRDSIKSLVQPVLIAPLKDAFQKMQEKVEEILASPAKDQAAKTKRRNRAHTAFRKFLDQLRGITVLDPACGSGNFLYISLHELKTLERDVILWGSLRLETTLEFPAIGPHVLRGIELNPYAAELARVVIWIGEIQWMINNGFHYLRDPVLRPMNNIECRDAVLDADGGESAAESKWPAADFIVGNPPFIGGKLMRKNLGDNYVERLFKVYRGRVAAESDYVCYWFEKARQLVADGKVRRAGLLATQGIRGGANRKVLEKIKCTGDIFLAWADRPWVVEGAEVHVSLIGFDDGTEKVKLRDGVEVPAINADLTAGLDLTKAHRLQENLGIAFMGDSKGGPFDILSDVAEKMLKSVNPNSKPNGDVIVPWVNGMGITRQPRERWIIDFGTSMTESQAALYEEPFEYIKRTVKPFRASSRSTIEQWWLHERPRVEMRQALAGLERFIGTVRHAKHRIFFWIKKGTLPDSALIVFAKDDDYTFGLLHSRPHTLWSLSKGTQVREKETGFRYTPTTTFETFPFPKPNTAQRDSIAEAAKELDEQRQRWLASGEKRRTLTLLYTENPTWLQNAHTKLDVLVKSCYGWDEEKLSDAEILSRLLKLNSARASAATIADD